MATVNTSQAVGTDRIALAMPRTSAVKEPTAPPIAPDRFSFSAVKESVKDGVSSVADKGEEILTDSVRELKEIVSDATRWMLHYAMFEMSRANANREEARQAQKVKDDLKAAEDKQMQRNILRSDVGRLDETRREGVRVTMEATA